MTSQTTSAIPCDQARVSSRSRRKKSTAYSMRKDDLVSPSPSNIQVLRAGARIPRHDSIVASARARRGGRAGRGGSSGLLEVDLAQFDSSSTKTPRVVDLYEQSAALPDISLSELTAMLADSRSDPGRDELKPQMMRVDCRVRLLYLVLLEGKSSWLEGSERGRRKETKVEVLVDEVASGTRVKRPTESPRTAGLNSG